MVILSDKNQWLGSHYRSNMLKHRMLTNKGHQLAAIPLPIGDYTICTDAMADTIKRRGDKLKKMDLLPLIKVTIDTKKDLSEVCQNICAAGHSRFRDEAILAQNNGTRFVVLVEEPTIHNLKDVFGWVNPRLKRWNYLQKEHAQGRRLTVACPSKPPTSGETLAKAMITMQNKYGIEWMFCSRTESADRIIEILSE